MRAYTKVRCTGKSTYNLNPTVVIVENRESQVAPSPAHHDSWGRKERLGLSARAAAGGLVETGVVVVIRVLDWGREGRKFQSSLHGDEFAIVNFEKSTRD
jgi:hypothetical protein